MGTTGLGRGNQVGNKWTIHRDNIHFCAASFTGTPLAQQRGMNALRLLLAPSAMALLTACNMALTPLDPLPEPSAPEEIPGPTYGTTTTAKWTPSTGRSFRNITAASTGDGAAIVYAESEDADSQGITPSRVLLQRLDTKGAPSGAPVELDTVELNAYAPPALALATDGVTYLACWQREGSIACAGVPVSEGPPFSALSVSGAWPSLAYGSGIFALAYGAPGQTTLLRVASDGMAAGEPTSFATGEGSYPRTFLAATGDGFALLDADDEWNGESSNVHLHRLESDFSPIHPPIDLGLHFWSRAAIAAHETDIAISLSKPYGGEMFTLEGGTVTHIYDFSAGGKLGINVGLLANKTSFDMLATHSVDLGLRYRTLQDDEVTTSEQTLLTDQDFDNSTLAPFRLKGGLFLATTIGWKGSEILVVRVDQP